MATIVPRTTDSGDIHYRVIIRLKGHPSQSNTFKRKTDAKRWAVQTEAAIREGRHFKSVEAKKHTLSAMIDRYLKEGFQHKPKSLKKQASQLEWWRSELGSYLLSDIGPALIAEKKSKLLTENIAPEKAAKDVVRNRTPSTVNRYLAVLSDAYTDAVKEWHWAQENPVCQVKKLAEPKGRVRFLSDEERVALLAECQASRTPELYPIVLLAMTTGARHGEIVNLRWKDIDMQRQIIVLHETKNKERRSLPIPKPALALLRTRSKLRRIDTDLVFPARDGLGPISIRIAFENALERAGIKDFRFHDLRHTAASYLAMSGATLAEIASVLGHKTLAMVKRYAHLTEQHTAGVVSRMNKKYF